MSATKRGNRGGDGADYFPTPAWCVRRLLEDSHFSRGTWMDPCAGDGAIIRAVNAVRQDVRWVAAEIREECRRDLMPLVGMSGLYMGDALAAPREFALGKADVLITNPPFSRAMEFIELALELAPTVAMLLRLNFLGSEERSGFLRTTAPDVLVLPNRPSFKANGNTDSIEYAWFVWRRWQLEGRERQSGIVRVLATTSAAERRADRAVAHV